MRADIVKIFFKSGDGVFTEVTGTSDGISISEYKSKKAIVKSYLALLKFIIFKKHETIRSVNDKINYVNSVLEKYYLKEVFPSIKEDVRMQFTDEELILPNYFG